MITKAEIRAAVLSKLGLRADSIVWDIGSGSGSVAVEAARIAASGRVYAVEKDKRRIADIEVNRARFAASNLDIVHGKAPGCLKRLKTPPDSVFIGGGGDGVVEILGYASSRMRRGAVAVVNAITIETAGKAFGFFKKRGWERELVLMSVSRTKEIGEAGKGPSLNMLSANNPVFIITGRKP